MNANTKPVVATAADRDRERFDDPGCGDISWFTYFSADRTPTSGMNAGLAELGPGGRFAPHRHAEAEIYFVHEGTGIVTVEGVETRVEPGMSIFIPGDAEHSIHNPSTETLKIFYVFATDSISDVVYRFPARP
jgi:mannose-6-phosphate isomerase-like protein (cupin superfamily)